MKHSKRKNKQQYWNRCIGAKGLRDENKYVIAQNMAYTIFFATSTGKTEDVADKLKELLPGTETKDVDNISSAAELAEAEALICCVPTWNTGADEGRSGTAWDTYAEEIPSMDFSGKTVGIVGLGDSSSYSDYFCDAMEELYTAFLQAGAQIIGKVSHQPITLLPGRK